jgi:hypothetical protein
MNLKQLRYLFERPVFQESVIFGLAGMFMAEGALFYTVLAEETPAYALGAVGGAVLLARGCKFWKGFPKRRSLNREIKEINKNKERFPLEHVGSIVIDDKAGLEGLLDRTNEKDSLEWGTFLKSHDDQGRAICYEILDSEEAETKRLITERKKKSVRIHISKAKRLGYNGDHHCHPGKSCANYDLSVGDRNGSYKGWLNLLSFNSFKGPEIIGYNKQHVYLPNNKEKTELVKATHKEVMKYLK